MNAIGSTPSDAATLTVVQPPVITSATAATVTFGQAFLYTITASNSPTSFSVTGLPAGLSLNAGTGAIAGSPTATGMFAMSLGATNAAGTGLATLTLTVNPAAATVMLGNLLQTYDGTPKSASVTTVPSGLAVTVTYDGSTVPPTLAASYAVVATVTTPGYSGSASSTLIISQASQTISFPALPAMTLGDPDFALTATASSGLPVTYQSDNLAVATISGSTLTIVGAGTANITAFQTGNNGYKAAAPVIQPLKVNPAPDVIDSDAPSMPLWALALLAVLLFAVAVPCLSGRRQTGGQ